ncbi:MAG: phytanoyl-CoA dioxygenase family protein, partial [Myxococcota bacterium]|nr:phytanoyl-CoA dioxygenase family protein [Myxococcota bacterium]
MAAPILSPEQIQRFQNDGYLVVPDVFDPEECSAFGRAVDEAVEGRASGDRRTLAEKTIYEQSFIQCINLW